MAAAESEDRQNYVKGKGKAKPPELATETTPLLQVEAGSSRSSGDDELDLESSTTARRQLWSKLIFVFLFTLSLCLVIFLAFVLLAYSYAARLSDVSPEDLLENGLVFEGPDRVDVLNATDGGLWINLEARVGIDAGSIIGVNSDGDEGTLRDVWKSAGRLGIRLLGTVSANLSTVYVYSSRHVLLGTVSSPPISLPITTNPPYDASWLTPISVPLFVRPTNSSSDLVRFVSDSWRHGAASVQVFVSSVEAWGGKPDARGWRSKLSFDFKHLEMQMSLPLPPIPGLPTPGSNTPLPSFSQIVSLQAFDIVSTPEQVTLNARASVINPAPSTFDMTVPTLPFIVSIPGTQHTPVSVASVHTQPFNLTHPNVTLFMSGNVLPLASDATEALSLFATRYLTLQRNPISIACPLFPSLVVDTEFPSPDTKPKLLRNVTIRNMKIKPTSAGGGFSASGEVFTRLVLPKGMNFMMDVKRVLPDVIVFDGEVPDLPPLPMIQGNVPSRLPSPIPPRAFGHIRPEDWLDAVSVYDGSDGEGSTFLVTASIEDVPMEVLPGRQKEFSNFVSKVIFSPEGALAGLQGTADVGVNIVGLPFHDGTGKEAELELVGLPFQGNVRIGKKGLLFGFP
ncbi:hypothetical protein HYDPIDRAFT_92125 [Hydnomerulius pinastri MD-312]|uniref:Uncharacterized protein n=1 Tax=Hydnomerulius pinastri MD-312 TaxID=994086 RepID=A0A0C9W867_9AGAM|nr:hypothetical protein HYDPIDRAFT_92125 [Hydnomerulius pinastri MD-312]